jgi:peptide/nickel transport system substrate-binding protein
MDFTLRPVRWEDGVPVTPRDLRVGAWLLRDPRVHSPDRPRTDLLRDCYAVDDSTVRLEFATIYARRRRDALLAPVPSHVPPWPAGSDTLRDRPYTGRVLACGPYRIANSRAQDLLLVRNDASGLPAARLDSVHVQLYATEDAVRDYREGRLDAIWDLPPKYIQEVRRRRGTRAIALVGRSYVFVGWNLRDSRLADPVVRRAAALAVDVPRLVRDLTLGLGDPARGPLTALAGFADTTALLPHDPGRARRLLDEAGWRDEDGDGVRERRGARLQLHLLVTQDDPLRVELGRRLARDLMEVGVRLELRELRVQELGQRLASGAFEAFIGQWFPDAEGGLDPVWRSESADRQNYVGYASRTADSLLTRLSHELDPPEREPILSAFQAHVYADQPYLFLFQNPHFLVLAPRVQGADPQIVSPFWNLPEWWIPLSLR